MKARELRELSVEELKSRLKDEEESLSNLRFQLSTSQLENPIKVRSVRRDIARIRTILTEKEAGARKPMDEVSSV
ncbi:MAG: 50S ribosomal protein L29 [Ignavibacteria bacterium]|nr:50S ribosomal protein L29 [Ignavibacteria bacterium]